MRKTETKTSPKKKTNRKTLTARQAKFIKFYSDPKSETFGNAKQSAIKAGYSNDYANKITVEQPQITVGKIKDKYDEMVEQAEKNLKEYLHNIPIDQTDKKIKSDATKFVLERLRKNKWSARTELTDPDGNAIPLVTGLSAGVVPVRR